MVSSLATVYAVAANDQAAQALSPLLALDWSLATALALLAWFVYAPQCISTLATIRRETNSWRQAGIAAGYLFVLAYLAAWLTYRVALGLGAGRSEEHTSELQSLMRISYAVFCLKKQNKHYKLELIVDEVTLSD